MIQLYQHQLTFVERLRAAFTQNQAVIGCAPCGFGKTCVAAFIAARSLELGRPVVFGVHRKELIKQTARTFDNFGIPYSYIAAGMPHDPTRLVQIGIMQTMTHRMDRLPPAALLVSDECHLSAGAGWSKIINHYRQTGAKILGLSGSPERADGKGLSCHYSQIVEGPSVAELISMGFLSDFRAFAPSVPDMTGVRTVGGDFDAHEAQERMMCLTGNAAEHYHKHANGLRMMAFCVSIAHSKEVTDQFNAAGIPTAHLDGDSSPEERRDVISRFADGAVEVLSSCSLCIEGFDLSAQVGREVPVEGVIMLRPTRSLPLFIQTVGRGLRKKPRPAILLDHAGNFLRFGLPDAPRAWSLDGRPKRQKEALPVASRCQSCWAMWMGSSRTCPQCGAVRELTPREVEHQAGELREIERQQFQEQAADRRREQGQAKTLNELIAIGKARGFRNPSWWARKVLDGRRSKSA